MKHLVAAALAFSVAGPALAGPGFSVDFEKAWDYGTEVAGYYAGGTASDGTSGPDMGTAFTGFSGLSNDAFFTYYDNAPSMQGVAYVFDATGSFLNVAAGAYNLSLYYSATENVIGAVRAYSGLNGTGTLLGTLDLVANGTAFDTWQQVSVAFNGVAQSFDFSNAANLGIAFDNISAIPEPGVVGLLAIGALAAIARRRRQG